ncbi:hypothetical protein TRIP_B200378 [uncultured Desulfatiglans sp.]|uniref:Uncharacterized protein n=1 Tax=Uncultured Desulfatiglans sp. TaxID=1748965 RepID=A0A653A2R0_UNCDX|nr:hypothetical protein TRIP_B200378 [uncultured Desulfatiglans sp.]
MNRHLCSRFDYKRTGRCGGRLSVKIIFGYRLSMKKARVLFDKNGYAEADMLPDKEPLHEAAK